MSFEIGSIVLHDIQSLDLEQAYESLGGEAILRAVSGLGLKQATWSKLRVTTSGSGWMPPSLAALDTAAQQTLKCAVPRSIPCSGLTATLPAARRSDSGHTPYGIAILPSGQAVKTAAALVGDVATVTAVSGATAYAVQYYPQLTVWALRPSASGNRGDASHRWELVCEEV
jgi:hypothetical protein